MKYQNIKMKLSKIFRSQLFWIQVCAVGIWLLVIQNFFGGEETAQCVYVVGGNIDASVSGDVNADVRGYVDVCNTVGVEVENTVPVRVQNPIMTW